MAFQMKAVILAGGKGTRLAEETKLYPKPMVLIGGKPIIWHILKILFRNGIKDFIICIGYKGKVIENYFRNIKEPWNVICVYTGKNTFTGKRLGLIEKYLKKEEYFLMTYGDGLANINVKKLLALHKKKKLLATVTAVLPQPRFGKLKIKNNIVQDFNEKKTDYKNLINGGYFILNKKIFQFLDLKKNVMWEEYPLKQLTKIKQLSAYVHKSFWYPMDTLRDKIFLNNLWTKNKAPWKIW